MRIEHRVVVGLQRLVAVWLLWPGLALPAPKPSLALAKLEVPASTASAPAVVSLVVTVDGLSAASAADAEFLNGPVLDEPKAAPALPTVTFGKPIALAGTDSQRSWVLPMTVAAMPSAATMTRYVSFKLGTVDWTLGYQLTSPASAATTWSLKPAPPSTLALKPDGDGLALNISVGGTAAIENLAGVVLLKEADGEALLADSKFTLCRRGAASCQSLGEPLQGAGTHQLWLKPSQPMTPGKYAGSITVSSADKPLGESANLTVYVTSWKYQLAGAGLIGVGVAFSLVFTTFLRHRLTRDQMRLAAALLRSGLEQLSRVLQALVPSLNTPQIDSRVTLLASDLSDSELEAFGLPPVVPLPMAPGQANNAGDTFKKRIEALAEWLKILQILVTDGVVRLHRRRAEHEKSVALNATQTAAFNKALRDLDQLAAGSTAPAANTLTANIEQALADFEQALAPPAPAPAGALGAPVRAQRLKSTQGDSPALVRGMIALEGSLAWGFVAVVTVLAGIYILVLANPGFGSARDLLACLLWGLGLPAGTLLASTTTASIASTYNVAR